MARYNKNKCLYIGIAVFILIGGFHVQKSKRGKPRWWVRPWATQARREAQGFASNLIQELRNTDTGSFRNFFRCVYFCTLVPFSKICVQIVAHF